VNKSNVETRAGRTAYWIYVARGWTV